MLDQSLSITLGGGSLISFFIFFIFYKVLHFRGIVAALLTALVILMLYLPLAILNWPGVDIFAIHFAFFMMIAYGLGIITSRKHKEGQKKGLHWGPVVIIVFFILLAMVDSTIINFATKGVEGGFAEALLPEPKKLDYKLDAESLALQEQRNKRHLSDEFKATYLEGINTGTQSKFPGTVAYDIHNREAKYNSDLLQLQQQKARGWKVEGGWLSAPTTKTSQIFRVIMVDKTGIPLKDLQLDIDFMRPSDTQQDQQHRFINKGDGSYEITTRLAVAGLWNIEIRAMQGDILHKIRGKTSVIPIQ
jgi:nitrogen fixation protein FixH